MWTVLIVDGNPDRCATVRAFLAAQGLNVISAESADEGARSAFASNPSLVVIEQSLPDGRGIDLTETLHASSDVPILLLHDAHDEMQTIMTLDRGADDVLSRPFGLGELAARIHALIRRYERVLRYLQFAELALQGVSGSAQNDEMFVVDTGARIITMNGEPLSLTSKEFELLSLFLQNPGRVFAKNELYSRLWDSEFEGDTRTVMVYISRLRKKIELHPEKPEMLINVWGLGYKYNPC